MQVNDKRGREADSVHTVYGTFLRTIIIGRALNLKAGTDVPALLLRSNIGFINTWMTVMVMG